jgi:hypothetical protein
VSRLTSDYRLNISPSLVNSYLIRFPDTFFSAENHREITVYGGITGIMKFATIATVLAAKICSSRAFVN